MIPAGFLALGALALLIGSNRSEPKRSKGRKGGVSLFGQARGFRHKLEREKGIPLLEEQIGYDLSPEEEDQLLAVADLYDPVDMGLRAGEEFENQLRFGPHKKKLPWR